MSLVNDFRGVDCATANGRGASHNFKVVSSALHLVSLCSIALSVGCLLLGAWILRSNPRGSLNRLLAVVCGGLFVWSFAYAFLPSAATKEQAWLWFRLSAVGWVLYPSLVLHLTLLLARRERWLAHRWVLPAIYLPGVLFLLQAEFGNLGIVDFIGTKFGWAGVYGVLTPSFAAYLVYGFGFTLGGLVVLVQWGEQSQRLAERWQTRVIVLTGLPVLVAATASAVVLPWMGVRGWPEIAHLIAPAWLPLIWWSLSRYRFVDVAPATAATEILRNMHDAIMLVDSDLRLAAANPAAAEMLSAGKAETLGHLVEDVLAARTDLSSDRVRNLLLAAESSTIEVAIGRQPSEPLPAILSVTRLNDEFDQDAGFVLTLQDIRERKRVEAELEHRSTHDALTDLPNRSLLHDRLGRALSRAKRDKRPCALLMLDLDGFKQINDAYGQGIGDIVLRSVARRLTLAVRGLDTVCRMDGDEFLIVVEDLLESDDSDIVAKRILAAFEDPISTGVHAVSIGGSIGIATYPFDGLDAETLLKKADLALASAKQKGRGCFQFYAPRLDAINRERMQIEQGLRRAIVRRELGLVYQPLVDLETGAIAGVEALLRWRSAELGMVGPSKFIPVAERSGLIVPIGRWVLESACRVAKEWQDAGLPALPVGVNISARQLTQERFVAEVEGVLRETGLSPHLLELELTESTAMLNLKNTQEIFMRLSDLGVRIVIDDFGTGYSSLMRLKTLPIHGVKIDRSFIENIDQDPRDRALVMAIVAMAKNMRVDVIAEGVETEEQLEVLRSFGDQPLSMFRCDRLQGYLFSRPLAKDEIPDLFAADFRISERSRKDRASIETQNG